MAEGDVGFNLRVGLGAGVRVEREEHCSGYPRQCETEQEAVSELFTNELVGGAVWRSTPWSRLSAGVGYSGGPYQFGMRFFGEVSAQLLLNSFPDFALRLQGGGIDDVGPGVEPYWGGGIDFPLLPLGQDELHSLFVGARLGHSDTHPVVAALLLGVDLGNP